MPAWLRGVARAGVCSILAVLLTPVLAFAAADVRFVVDVSAPTAALDPDNQRGRALGALLRMLPDDGRAGVWTYDGAVRTLAAFGRSNRLWKETAAIHCASLTTGDALADLAAALDQATWDRAGRGEGTEQDPVDVVLLGNGRLDVAPQDGLDGARTRRLIADLAPELAAAGYRIHTLTFADSANRELLGQLAAITGGYQGDVESPAALAEKMLDLLGWVAGPAGLTVDPQGAFEVPAGTRALTVMRLGNGADGEALVDPLGQRWPRTVRRDRVRWHIDRDYELVTVADPAPGVWRFDGVAPDLQPRVYGDLGVAYRDLPGTLFPAGLRAFAFDLTSDGAVIRDPDFLDLLQVSARLHGPQAATPLVVERIADGGFQVNLLGPREPGDYLLETRVRGPTFHQDLALPLRLVNPLGVEVRPAEDGFVVWVRVAAPELDHGSLRLAGLVTRPPASTRLMPFERHPAGLWKLTVPGARGVVEIELDLSGKYLNYRDFNLRTDPVRLILPVTAVERINLDLDGRRVIVADAAGQPGPATSGATPPGARPPGVAGTPGLAGEGLDEQLELPVWFAAVAGLINLLIGLSLWWMAGDRPRPEELLTSVAGLRVRLGVAEPEPAEDTGDDDAGQAASDDDAAADPQTAAA